LRTTTRASQLIITTLSFTGTGLGSTSSRSMALTAPAVTTQHVAQHPAIVVKVGIGVVKEGSGDHTRRGTNDPDDQLARTRV
jgi:hypothetical protein